MVILQWRVPEWADRFEGMTVDARFRLRGRQEPSFPIVIVALDEDSFQMLGDLEGENIRTWPRANWAQLVEMLASGEPSVIALDVAFDTPGWDVGGDELLAQALSAAGSVVLPAHFQRTGAGVHSNMTLSPPISALASASAVVGVAAAPFDADGSVRRTTLVYPAEGGQMPSLAVAAVALYAGEVPTVDRTDLDDNLSLPINFRGPEGTFDTYSLHGVLSGEISPELFRDSIVLVGYTTRAEQDRHRTPFPSAFAQRAGMPGVEIQANAIDTLLAGDWLQRPPDWLPVVLVAMLGLMGLVALNLRRLGVGLITWFAAVLVYLIVGQGLFSFGDYLLPLVAPVASVVVVGAASLAERFVFVERDKRRLRQRFAGVMSPERLRAVLDDWESLLEVERPQKEAAVLFADVRGFTRTTEKLMRQNRSPEMISFLSAYLDAMAEAVFAEGGVIYDVVGDGLMILFGVPDPSPDYAVQAVRAAVRMALASEDLQAVWPLRDERPVEMGIGVHCGPVVDAMVGRGRRVEYAVVGDPVNTAARIESYCKEAMEVPRPPGGEVPETVTILLSEDLYLRVADQVLADESVPCFEARGKADPLRVVRLLGMQEGLRGQDLPEQGLQGRGLQGEK
jgi:adenylate cyclase